MRMGCGVSDLSLPEVTSIVHGIIFKNSKKLQEVDNDPLSF